MTAPSDGPSKRVEWRIYGVIVDGSIVCTLASDERVDRAGGPHGRVDGGAK